MFEQIICRAAAFILLVTSGLLLTTDAAAKDRPLRVGVIATSTGPVGSYGVAVHNGITLAREELHDNSTLYYFENVEYDSKQAVTAFQKLVNSDRVDIIYVWGVNFCVALAPLAEANKKLMIAECVCEEVDVNRNYVQRFMTGSSRYMQAQLKVLREKGVKKIGVVLTENTYLEEMLRALTVSLRKDESVVVLDRFGPASNDFRSTLTALRNSPVDALGVFLTTGQIGTFYKQLRVQKLHSIPTFGTNFFDSESERLNAQGSMDGALYVTDHVPDDFAKRYQERFQINDDLNFAFYAYRFGKVVEAVGRLGSFPVTKPDFLRIGEATVGPFEFSEDTFDVMKVVGEKAVVDSGALRLDGHGGAPR